MAFYDQSKQTRIGIVANLKADLAKELLTNSFRKTLEYFANEDTYIRKAAYTSIGNLYHGNENFQETVIKRLNALTEHENFLVRQTVINAAGEIGKKDFESVRHVFETGLFDSHHAPRNAVIGSLKKMGEVNPKPVLKWAKNYLHHSNPEIRREICHGIELRGRKHPQDILPLLRELQHDIVARVRNTLVHVLGQIAYKKGCLAIVVADLKAWENTKLVEDAFMEIIDVHERYKDFADLTTKQAKQYITTHYGRLKV